jgi:hypothetical protein
LNLKLSLGLGLHGFGSFTDQQKQQQQHGTALLTTATGLQYANSTANNEDLLLRCAIWPVLELLRPQRRAWPGHLLK